MATLDPTEKVDINKMFPEDFDDPKDTFWDDEDEVVEDDAEEQDAPASEDEGEEEEVRVQEAPSAQGTPPTPQPPPSSVESELQRLRKYESTLIPALQREAQQFKTEADKAKADIAAFKTYQEQFQSFGLKPEDAQAGLQMIASLKANPAKFVQDLATRLRLSGHQIDGPVGDPNANLIAETITRQLAPYLEPLKAHQEKLRQEQEMEQKVQAEMVRLQTELPELVIHQNEIALIMQNHLQTTGRPMSAEMAYAQLARYAASNGFDFNKPLKDQFFARQQQAQPTATTNNSQTRANPSPSVSTRRGGTMPPASNVVDQFSSDTGYRDAVRQAAAEVLRGRSF